MIWVLKGMFLGVLWAVGDLLASGQCFLALAAVPMLVTLFYVTRGHARRRARGSGIA